MKLLIEIDGGDAMNASQIAGRVSYLAEAILKSSDLRVNLKQPQISDSYGGRIGGWRVVE